MKKRCCNPNNPQFKYYGGRGITICKEWLNPSKAHHKNATEGWLTFEAWAINNGYTDELTLDRIDNDKGYSPANCRWTTMQAQCNNKRSNHLITYKGQTKTLKVWCTILNLNYDKTKQRINSLNWSIERAFETN
jgi:hypothetical protein